MEEFNNTTAQQQHCLNCGAALPENARYCPDCGQKVTDGRESLRSILEEFVESLFNVDSRFFRTLRDIFIPGKLTIAYFSGKHKSYVHPIRLLLVSTVILITVINLVLKNVDADFTLSDVRQRWEQADMTEQFVVYSDSIREVIQGDFPQPMVQVATDSFYVALAKLDSIENDTVAVPFSLFSMSGNDRAKYARHDLITMSPKELADKYLKDRSFWFRLKSQQELRFFKSGQNIVTFFLSNVTWQALLALPLVALYMQLLYIRRKFYYVEHLIFSIHNTALFFIAVTILSVFDSFLPEIVDLIVMLLVFVYLLFSMKRFYQQNWWKTVVKQLLAVGGYIFILAIAFLFVNVLSILLL
ncbi:MAG: DUF3667 domain-containing protein [Bacteroidota bacterium]